MAPIVRIGFDAFKEAEKLLKYRFFDKERERSNRAAGMAKLAAVTKRRWLLRHQRIAWSGPPHDSIRAYVCLECSAAACEPEIKDMGYEFETVPDWIIHRILDLDLQRQAEGNRAHFGGLGGRSADF